MALHLAWSSNIFESLSVLSGFSLAGTIWEKYEKFAVHKIEESTVKLRGTLYYLREISPKEAGKELKALDAIIPVLRQLRNTLEPIDQKEFQDFKRAALEFFDTVDFLHDNLEDIAGIHSSYKMSIPVLSDDWSSKENDHWDNY